MKYKISWIIFGILMISLISLFWAKSIDEDSWICAESGWIEHGKPSSAKPTIPCGITDERSTVEKYVSDNISNLSTTKEVLGGKFYVNKVVWTENNSGVVEYEDGHILLKATFDYSVTTKGKNNDYIISINNFKITQ